MEDGWVAGYSEVQGPSDPPTITDMYLNPSYHSTDPYEPMPCWFHRMLTGDPAQYYTLREAIGKLDNWAHLAEVTRYRKLEDDIVTAQAQVNSLRADIKGWTQAKELCEVPCRSPHPWPHRPSGRTASMPHWAEGPGPLPQLER